MAMVAITPGAVASDRQAQPLALLLNSVYTEQFSVPSTVDVYRRRAPLHYQGRTRK